MMTPSGGDVPEPTSSVAAGSTDVLHLPWLTVSAACASVRCFAFCIIIIGLCVGGVIDGVGIEKLVLQEVQ